MKLLTRTNIYFIVITLIVFSLGGEVFYERVHSINKNDAVERLEQEKQEVLNYIHIKNALPQNSIFLGDSLAFIPMSSAIGIENNIGHIKLYNPAEKEWEPFETIEFAIGVNSEMKIYKTIIYRPLLEADDLTTGIIEAMLIIGSCLLILLLISNFIISKLLWRPFYKTLGKIKSFDLTKENHVEFGKTSIKEFKTLNEVLKTMTEKIASDYRNLKEFTENASHEMQTPLSIIQSKLELLIQSENLTAEQMQEVQVVYESAARLAKLNQALLLLAKIENNQFTEARPVKLDELIKAKLLFFEEWIRHKNISVEVNLQPLTINIHPMLADILVSNLIGNAIKHNVEKGKLIVKLNGRELVIQNSGKPLTIAPEQLFQRFRKADPATDSLGLGLAIVMEICSAYDYSIDYKYGDNLHSISIGF